MKKTFLLLFSVLLISCSDNQSENLKSDETKIFSFSSTKEFDNLLNSLSQNLSEEKVISWSKINNENSILLKEIRNEISVKDDLPLVMKAILNSNYQFKIGNKFITFSEGSYYETKDINENLSKNKIVGKVETKNVENSQNEDSQKVLTSNDSYKEWDEWNRLTYRTGCGTPVSKPLKYRLVHELKAIKSVIHYSAYSEVSMNFRMSYNAGNGWGDATETQRLLNFSLGGTLTMIGGSITGGGGTSSVNISGNFTCSNPAVGNKKYVLGGVSFPNNYGSDPSWSVSISGSITHKVNGDHFQNGYENLTLNW